MKNCSDGIDDLIAGPDLLGIVSRAFPKNGQADFNL
jgi:hypothetical protein